jgi:membrane associated rhomboid family serine protease
VYKNQWWRLLSSIMLHGGIFHIIPNGAIQVSTGVSRQLLLAKTVFSLLVFLCLKLRVGGYLNLVYGTPKWFFIYFISGIFGEMMR